MLVKNTFFSFFSSSKLNSTKKNTIHFSSLSVYSKSERMNLHIYTYTKKKNSIHTKFTLKQNT